MSAWASATGVGAETGAGRVTGTGREINCVLPLVETDDEGVDGLVETRFWAFACFAAGADHQCTRRPHPAAAGS